MRCADTHTGVEHQVLHADDGSDGDQHDVDDERRERPASRRVRKAALVACFGDRRGDGIGNSGRLALLLAGFGRGFAEARRDIERAFWRRSVVDSVRSVLRSRGHRSR
eukprot:2092293-Pleurochrysis_carterae.AAC.1